MLSAWEHSEELLSRRDTFPVLKPLVRRRRSRQHYLLKEEEVAKMHKLFRAITVLFYYIIIILYYIIGISSILTIHILTWIKL